MSIEHSSQSVQSQGQVQPQPGHTFFSLEIEVSVMKLVKRVVIIMSSLDLVYIKINSYKVKYSKIKQSSYW